ncbi:MAG: hypothetical protein HC837_12075 [Chloroflexaceae bacterium]|nr:hypothetical protein [Chloroflexaceae bacterium]
MQGSTYDTALPLTGSYTQTVKPAVTSVTIPDPDNPDQERSYIYVFGGEVQPFVGDARTFSSFATRIGTVDPETGKITEWRTSDGNENWRIPNGQPTLQQPYTNQFGLDSATAVSLRIGNATYIYLVGGFNHRQTNFETLRGSRVVYSTRVNDDGTLVNPCDDTIENVWCQEDGIIPLPNDLLIENPDAGLWNSIAFVDEYFGATATITRSEDDIEVTNRALFVMGGQQLDESIEGVAESERYNTTVFRAVSIPKVVLIGTDLTFRAGLARSAVFALALREHNQMELSTWLVVISHPTRPIERASWSPTLKKTWNLPRSAPLVRTLPRYPRQVTPKAVYPIHAPIIKP